MGWLIACYTKEAMSGLTWPLFRGAINDVKPSFISTLFYVRRKFQVLPPVGKRLFATHKAIVTLEGKTGAHNILNEAHVLCVDK